MKLTAHRCVLFAALCSALLLAVATAASIGASSAAAKAGGATAGSAAPLNPAHLQSMVNPLFSAVSAVDGHGLGLRPGPQDFSYAQGMRVPLASVARERVALPATYDLRSLGRVTSVKNQGSFGTCWAFASCGSLESGLLPGESLDSSEDNMVLASGFGPFSGGAYDHGGNLWMSTAYLTRWGGPVYESDDAYGDGVTPSALSARKHVQEVNWIPARGSALDNDNVKNAVAQYGGAYVAMGWYGSAYKSSTASYYYDGGSGTNHGVLIVGWDDTYPATNFATAPPGNGAFIVKNSWGASWGSSGCFYVSYYDTKFGRDGVMAVIGADAISNYSGVYQYDPLGDCAGYGYSSSTGWFANVYTAQTTASLSAVGFYTMAPGTSYEVYTGSSLATKTLSASGTQAYMGYHTVALPTPVTLTSGGSFVVAVKVTSPGASYPIAFEAPYSGYSDAATAQAGQSYVSSTGSSWTDLTTQIGNANVCLKAYTTAAVIPVPTLTGFAPASGPVGTSVTLTGSGLSGATAVAFHGTAAASFNATSATAITAVVPAGATTGTVSVTTPGGTATSGESFTVTPSPMPTISAFAPTAGPVGTSVTLTGTGFIGVSAVSFNGTAAAFTVVSPTSITTTAPAGATSGTISVTTPGGTATSVTGFSVIPPPGLSLVAPATGPVGATVTLTGSALESAGAVRFNGATATFSVDSSTQITATVPTGATSGPITVTTAGGTASSATSFVVIPTPTLTYFTPDLGAAGASVTLTGSGFIGATKVAFNGADAATFAVVGPTQITATVPAGATSGPVTVTTPGGTAASVASFTVVPAPGITRLAPAAGPVGTIVTITGAGFAGATAVTVGGVAAPFSVVSSAQITATVPNDATGGQITVTTPGGIATSTASFTVIFPPTVASFTPASGPVGARVTLTGSGFSGATAVRFNGIAASFSVAGPTQITTVVPIGATTGPIAVTTPAGTGAGTTSFTVVATAKATLKLSGLKRGALVLGKSMTASGRVTPVILAGSTVKVTTQLKKSGRWTTVKTSSATSSLIGAYSWKYKPAKKGAYRMQASIAQTATHTAATTAWLTFKVQ